MGKFCAVHKVACVLLVIGGLNWGLIGLFQYNLVMALLGSWPMVERAVYVLVGISALLSCNVGGSCCKKMGKM